MRKIIPLLIAILAFSKGHSATFTSIINGNWSSPATWSIVGADADSIPDSDDDVIIGNNKTVTDNVASCYSRSLTINPSCTLNLNHKTNRIYGNFVNNGTPSGIGTLVFYGSGFTISSSAPYTNAGNWYFISGSNMTINSGTVISKQNYFYLSTGTSVTNNGQVYLSTGSISLAGTASWTNLANSVLAIGRNISGTGTLTCSAVPNTVAYTSNLSNTIYQATSSYYNLNLSSASAVTKSLISNISVINNINIGTNVTLNCANFSIVIGGNWNNTGNNNCTNMATVTFNGSGTQNISRTSSEIFNNFTQSGTGILRLNRNVIVNGTTTLANGTLNLNSFQFHQRGASWLNNGGSINTATGSVIFDGSVAQTIGGSSSTTFGNFQINDPGFTVTCTIDQTAVGNTTLTGGTFSPGTADFHQQGASWNANGGSIATAASGNIIFDGTIPQTIGGSVGASFGNIEINSSSTVTLGLDLNAVGSLSILAGTLDVSATPFNITIGGNFLHNGGTFTAQTGTVTFNGSAAQTISGSATTTFNNITSDNSLGGVSVTSIIIINGILQVNNRSFGTSGFGSIILTATGPTTYAKIGPLGASASLVGTAWTIGSYIDGPATAYWQYLGSPINGATLADWDNDNRFYMSGVGGNDGNACCPIFHSVRTYSPVTNTYSDVTSVSTTLTTAKGYMVWIADNQSQLTAPLPYDTKGTPNQGTVLFGVTAGGPGAGYNLVSNPYACPIDYASVVASSGNLQANFLILLENGSYTTNPNGGIIAPNQGFMAICTASGNIKFLESNKTTSTNPNILRTSYPENYLRISASNGLNGLGGEAVLQINNRAHNGKDIDYDMPFLASPYEGATNIWTTDNDAEDLLLNAMDGIADRIDIPLFVKSGTPGTQLLSFKGLNSFSAYSCAYLEDIATGEKINLKEHDTYSFEATAAGERHSFNLHFERDGNCPLNEQQITQSLDASSQVFTNNGNILVKFGFEESTDVVVTILDVTGKEVMAPKSYTVSNETIAPGNPDAHGIYLVRIVKGDEISTKKIYY